MDGVKMFPMLVYLVLVLKGHHDLKRGPYLAEIKR